MSDPKTEALKTVPIVPTDPVKPTTWPDVADSALESLKEGLGDVGRIIHSIGKELSEAAPQVWHALVEYHRWLAYGRLGLSCIYFIICIYLIRFSWKQLMAGYTHGKENPVNRYSNSEWPAFDILRVVISGIVILISLVLIIVNIEKLPYTIGDAVVPERAAAIEIIQSIKSGGSIPQR